ncbi:MAG: prephenate dehydrogenase, partial [Vulcanimicrobiaceae bacterium]
EEALRRGALDARVALGEALARAGTLVLAIPADATCALLGSLSSAPPRAQLILDVASVKTASARAGAALQAFVPSHPIAGGERSGPAAARADLFEGAVWVFDPAAAAPAQRYARALIERLGGRPLPLASEQHDRLIALSSHLPQVLSVALGARVVAAAAREPEVLALCGPGIRSMLRLGGSSWAMWRPILAQNAAPLAQEVRALAEVLCEAARALESGSPEPLEARFAEAAATVACLGEGAQGRSDV